MARKNKNRGGYLQLWTTLFLPRLQIPRRWRERVGSWVLRPVCWVSLGRIEIRRGTRKSRGVLATVMVVGEEKMVMGRTIHLVPSRQRLLWLQEFLSMVDYECGTPKRSRSWCFWTWICAFLVLDYFSLFKLCYYLCRIPKPSLPPSFGTFPTFLPPSISIYASFLSYSSARYSDQIRSDWM